MVRAKSRDCAYAKASRYSVSRSCGPPYSETWASVTRSRGYKKRGNVASVRCDDATAVLCRCDYCAVTWSLSPSSAYNKQAPASAEHLRQDSLSSRTQVGSERPVSSRAYCVTYSVAISYRSTTKQMVLRARSTESQHSAVRCRPNATSQCIGTLQALVRCTLTRFFPGGRTQWMKAPGSPRF